MQYAEGTVLDAHQVMQLVYDLHERIRELEERVAHLEHVNGLDQ